MSNGVRITDKTSLPTIDKIVGIKTQGNVVVGYIDFDDFVQLLLAGDIGDEIGASAAGLKSAETWTALAATPGTSALQPGRVAITDAGTHTDPVVGGTVPNAGEYRWNVSPAGWKRIGATPSLAIIQSTTGPSDAAKPIGTDAAGKMHFSFLPAMIQYLQDEGLLFAAGDGLRALLGVSDDGAGTLLGPWAGMMSDLAHVPDARPRLYLAGHSWCKQCSSDYATEARGWLWWLQFLSGASFDFQLNQNYGLGGSDTTDLVRQSLELSTQPSGIVINMSGINDLIFTADHSIMNYEASEALQTKVGGHRSIWVTDAPRGDGNGKSQSAGLTGDTLEYKFRREQWQREAGGRKGVYSADIVPPLINPSSATAKAIDTVFYDGLHLGPPGALLVAKALLPTIDFLVPRRSRLPITNADTYTANNVSGSLFDNPLMLGSVAVAAANCSGFIATGVTPSAGAGLSAAFSKVPRADGLGDWQQVILTGTPSGAHTDGPPLNVDAVSCVLTMNLDKDDFTAGDIIEAVCAAEIDTGHSGVRGIPIYLVATAGGVDYVVCGGEPNMAAEGASVKAANLAFPDPGTKLAGVNITPQLTVPASLSAIKLKMLVTAKGGTAINATVRFSRAAPRKVVYNG